MDWRLEILSKAVAIFAAIVAAAGALFLFAIGLLANGSAISELDFSWWFFAFSGGMGLCQLFFAIAGCRAAFRWIDRWSEELAETRQRDVSF
jgi:hypothetical protein